MGDALGATEPFYVSRVGNTDLRVASDDFRLSFIRSMEHRSVKNRSLTSDPIGESEEIPVESAELTVGIGGGAAEWLEERRRAGLGIVVVPPAGWDPAVDSVGATWGPFVAMATASFAAAQNHANVNTSGFVLAEPAGGWLGVATLAPEDRRSTESLLVAAAAAVCLAAVVYLAWGKP